MAHLSADALQHKLLSSIADRVLMYSLAKKTQSTLKCYKFANFCSRYMLATCHEQELIKKFGQYKFIHVA